MQTECTRSPAISEGEQNGFYKLLTTPSMKIVAQTKLHNKLTAHELRKFSTATAHKLTGLLSKNWMHPSIAVRKEDSQRMCISACPFLRFM